MAVLTGLRKCSRRSCLRWRPQSRPAGGTPSPHAGATPGTQAAPSALQTRYMAREPRTVVRQRSGTALCLRAWNSDAGLRQVKPSPHHQRSSTRFPALSLLRSTPAPFARRRNGGLSVWCGSGRSHSRAPKQRTRSPGPEAPSPPWLGLAMVGCCMRPPAGRALRPGAQSMTQRTLQSQAEPDRLASQPLSRSQRSSAGESPHSNPSPAEAQTTLPGQLSRGRNTVHCRM
mmetsp:Transcript_16275/g.45337  ORF Transcript_16275/g.45337 Transcript_16275/m.45337 type:complete len:230 (+) Transcript_16275:426-1115(+)